MYPVVLNLSSRSTLPFATSVAQPASPEPQRLPSLEADLDKNSAKSPGSAVLCRCEPCARPLRCESREVGPSSKLCQTFYRRRTQVWRMDLPDVCAEFGSCCRSARVILIRILQNRQEMQFSAKDRLALDSYCAEVGRQGHPPNFVRPSIEEEQKFGGWICQRWVPRSAVAGRCGGANVLRKCKIARKCNPSVWIGRERVATVQKSEAGSSPKLCRIFYRRKTEVLGMDLSELGVMKRGLEGLARLRLAGIRQLKGSVCEGVRR